MRHYDSDDSAMVRRDRAQRRARRERYRSPSQDSCDRNYDYDDSPRRSSYPSEQTRADRPPQTEGLGKATLAVGIISVVAGLLHVWNTKKKREREEAERRWRKEDFERRKADRRRREAKRERERQRRMEEECEPEPVSNVRRIGYAPMERSRSRSRSRHAVRQIEAPPDWDGREDDEVAEVRRIGFGRDHDRQELRE
jgi:hypothetical protein